MGEATYLDENLLEIPEMAVNQAHRQTLEMGEVLREEMFGRVLPALHFGTDEVIDQMTGAEPAIDSLYKKISSYLARLGGRNLSDELMQRSIQILYAANDLEHIGDLLMRVAQIAQK